MPCLYIFCQSCAICPYHSPQVSQTRQLRTCLSGYSLSPNSRQRLLDCPCGENRGQMFAVFCRSVEVVVEVLDVRGGAIGGAADHGRIDVLALEDAFGIARPGSRGPAPVTPTRASVQTPSSSRVITAATPTTA